MVSAVENALRMLEAVAKYQPIGVSAVARKLEMSKTTAQRALVALADLDWIAPAPGDSTRWVLTTKAFAIGSQHAGATDLRQLARAPMKRLFDEVGETIHLSVIDGAHVVVIELLETEAPVRTHTRVGDRFPLHATASGIAMLAAMDQDRVDRILTRTPLEKVTEFTPTDVETIHAAIEDARKLGYARALGTRHAEIAAIAAPILDRNGAPTAALSISAPIHRLPPDKHQAYGQKVRAAAQASSGIYVSYSRND
ncbi:IclR family transcriptional regulator [Rhodococcus sp. NPDC057529]|uniref:IclR family transcriptional regulator n=1 Tax=Rhodococcus sp. NPDC057529 TaxID=3346158 RepID=UPI0036706973